MNEKIPARKILVLEDDFDLRDNLMELFTFKGFEVLKTKTGYLGIQMAKNHLPDIIICSRMFADIDCLDVFQALQIDKATQKIPFIFLSSNPSGERHQKMNDSQTPIILTKPFSIEELIAVIEDCLKN